MADLAIRRSGGLFVSPRSNPALGRPPKRQFWRNRKTCRQTLAIFQRHPHQHQHQHGTMTIQSCSFHSLSTPPTIATIPSQLHRRCHRCRGNTLPPSKPTIFHRSHGGATATSRRRITDTSSSFYILITSFPNANTQQIIMPWLHQCHSVPTTQQAPFTIKHECNDNMPSRSLHRHRRTIMSKRTTSTVILPVIILSAFAVILSAFIVSVIITTRQSKHASLSTSRRRMGGGEDRGMG